MDIKALFASISIGLPPTLFLVLFRLLSIHNLCTGSLVLPLKTQLTPSMSLPFRTNVTLTISITVGTPPQDVILVLDTASELSWLHCKQNPIFNPLLSTSYIPLPCSSSVCTTKTQNFPNPVSCDSNRLCHAILSYADATSLQGNLAYEIFHIRNVSTTTVFGCMETTFSSNPEPDTNTTGLIGMNRGPLSFVSQMGYQKFAYCIAKHDTSGVLLLGESAPFTPSLHYTPLVQINIPLPYFDRIAYTIQLQGIRVGQTLLPLSKSVFLPDHTGAGQTMVDSGTQFTFLLGPVYTVLRNEFLNQTKSLLKILDEPNFLFQSSMDLCYLVPLTQPNLPSLPTVSLLLPGAEILVSGDPLLYKVPDQLRGKDQVYCFTFGNSDRNGLEAYVIGHHHQQDMWVEFDLKSSRLGFAPTNCAQASRNLGIRF